MGVFGPGTGELTIDFGQISERIPQAVVKRILEETERESVRRRKLPAYLMTYYVIASALMVSGSAREVLRQLVRDVRDQYPDAKSAIATRAAICKARLRLGVQPIRQLFEQVVKPIAKKSTQGAWFMGLRLVALDGSSLHLQDTPGNRKRYGKQARPKGKPVRCRWFDSWRCVRSGPMFCSQHAWHLGRSAKWL